MSSSGTGPILLCYDSSDGARRAIEVAGALFPGRKAVVLHVWSPIAVVAAAYGGLMPLPDYDESALEKVRPRGRRAKAPTWPRRPGSTRPREIAEGTYEGTWHTIVEAAREAAARR